jgi:hypothetical protein
VAHREEILVQALNNFRGIRPHDELGYFTGERKDHQADVLFASVQTLSRRAHLEAFSPEHFDYVVVDEFHHASAATYRRMIQYFKPSFLLGLTATPERSDGADLLDLCGGNLIYRCDLTEGIRQQLLCPFTYYGVPDEIDYSNIPWRSTRFDEQKLTEAAATQSRARNALDQLRTRGGRRTLAFCVSQRHADFMAEFFEENGVRAVAVHAGPKSAPRTESLERLRAGDLQVICTVDMFNEGVDVPELDTVMMLRPTESRVVWLQQFGRGLRKSGAAKRLTVIDYIGNHRTFLLKPQTLFNLGHGDAAIQNLLEQLQAGTAELPPGCEVTYDLEAIEILRGLLRISSSAPESIRAYIVDFVNIHGVRPTALEAYRDGYNPRAVRGNYGSWFAFLESSRFLIDNERVARQGADTFLEQLEVTPMVKSFKMLVLLAMLDAGGFQVGTEVSKLAAGVRDLLVRYPDLAVEFRESLSTTEQLIANLERNPIDAWIGGRRTGGAVFFRYEERVFSSVLNVEAAATGALQDLTRELAEWRLAEYRGRADAAEGLGYVLPVARAGGRPILFPLDRKIAPDLPEGWTPVLIDDARYRANFVRIAVNVIRAEESDDNALPSLLRGWFGPEAGAAGTRHRVRLVREGDAWRLAPIGAAALSPVVWKAYSREQIPGLFGLKFSEAIWNQGFVRRGDKTFLLVTLDKTGKIEEHQYRDRFIAPDILEWQSQNRTARASEDGESIVGHASLGIDVHLFVRATRKTAGIASAFVYCGIVKFVSWKGEGPITVRWQLSEPIPERLCSAFSVGS